MGQGSMWGKAGEFSELVGQVTLMLGFLTCVDSASEDLPSLGEPLSWP